MLDDDFGLARHAIADLGDGAGGRGPIRGQQVEHATSVLLNGDQALDVDLLPTHLLGQIGKAALCVRSGDSEVVCTHHCPPVLELRVSQLTSASGPG